MDAAYAIGLDYGTNSVRAVVVDCADGRSVGTHVFDYPSGEQGILLDARDPHLARQNPADYVEGLRASVKGALAEAERAEGFERGRVVGIGVDTTGSTPLPVDGENRPLALDARWKGQLAAQAWLWKDHTARRGSGGDHGRGPPARPAVPGAHRRRLLLGVVLVEDLALPQGRSRRLRRGRELDRAGRLRARRPGRGRRARARSSAASARPATRPSTPTPGGACRTRRSSPASIRSWPRCATGSTTRPTPPTAPRGACAKAWAEELGLREGIPVAMGGFDAHYGAVGAGVKTGTLVKIIGTSTCDCAIASAREPLAGRSRHLRDRERIHHARLLRHRGRPVGGGRHPALVGGGRLPGRRRAARGAVGGGRGASGPASRASSPSTGTTATGRSWSTRASPASLLGQTLHTTRAEIYRALIEATAFGARAIVERLQEYGVPVERVVCCGGIAEKNDLFMQIYADVLGHPMLVAGSPQTPALGSAISAAVAAGRPPDLRGGPGADDVPEGEAFTPDPAARARLRRAVRACTASCTTPSAASPGPGPTSRPS